MTEFFVEKFKKNWEFILAAFLWLCIWATYNTDINRFFTLGFPHNILDLIHGLRSLLPFLALILSTIILFKNRPLSKKIFATPLGLLSIFTIVGIFSSIFSQNPFMAFYWGFLYGSVILVLLTILENKDLLKKIIKINWVIAGILALGLTLFFLIQPGAVKSLTFNFLICSQRPYEGLGNIGAAINTFGMAGTRPTGLGRYAGLVAITAFVSFCFTKNRLKFIWFLTFIIFLGILFFSKGKTEIIGFIVAIVFTVFASNKLKPSFILGTILIILLSGFIIFYNIPCTNTINVINFTTPKTVVLTVAPKCATVVASKIIVPVIAPKSVASVVAPKSVTTSKCATAITNLPKSVANTTVKSAPEPLKLKNIKSFSTLSGRTNGVWSDAWHLFLSNPLVGYGFQADRFSLNGQHAHNSMLHALIQAGILGTIPFVLAFILIFFILLRLFKNPKIEKQERNFLIMLSSVLVFFTVRSITESVAFFSADWLLVAPIIAYIQCLDNKLHANNNSKNSVLDFLGNKIDIIAVKKIVEKMSNWIKQEHSKLHWIVNTAMHGIVEAEKHADFKYIINSADMFVPDGISVVWLARLKGFDMKKRITAADLMQEFFKVAEKESFSNYFYGDTNETLQALNKKLLLEFPNLKIAGSYSPPFREPTEEEDRKIIEKINQAKPDVLWVGLGLPKQEKWIFEHKEKLDIPVVIGVGAGFKFLSGKVRRVPSWLGNFGLEWLWRFLHEPKRIWRRVFIYMPIFFWLVVKDFLFRNS
jgi:N-acetylglucosaminyldiphosphoundecaprenol N-acetyl-beta-D-mannosaminyltransferase